MANNYTNISFIVPCSEVAAETLIGAIETQEEAGDYGLSIHAELDDDGVWICHDESADIEQLVEILQEWLAEPEGRPKFVGFEFAQVCSKPRLNEFGGGAVVVTATSSSWTNTSEWLRAKVAETEAIYAKVAS